jgi:K+-transporting ATPase c subunit
MRGLIGLIVVLGIGYFIYRQYLGQILPKNEGGGSPIQAINTTGVKNDLIGIAQAERLYQAQHGSYTSLDELVNSGAMNMARSGREGYTYTVDAGGSSFTVNARYSGPISPPPPNFAIDQTMEVHVVP